MTINLRTYQTHRKTELPAEYFLYTELPAVLLWDFLLHKPADKRLRIYQQADTAIYGSIFFMYCPYSPKNCLTV